MSDNPLRPASVRVPGSTSNLGAGFDCIGLAVQRRLTAAYEPGPEPLRIVREGTLAALHVSPEDDALLRAFAAELRRRGHTGEADSRPTGTIRAASDIPIGRGLGSSAAAIVAGLALAAAARGGPADPAELLARATELEGHPDNAAPALHGGLVAVARDADGCVRAVPLPLSPALGLAYAAPGEEVSTAMAREALPDTVHHDLAARGLGRMAALLRGLATAEPELLRIGFADELHVPHRLPLVPGATAATDAARRAGAWAVTISGAGSGLIAVCPPDRAAAVADAMAAAFRREAGPEGVVGFPAPPERDGLIVEPEDGGSA